MPIRSHYYRAVWLPQLRPATVTVDGEKFEGAQITWTIGGLKMGSHEVEVTYTYSTSYIPPRADERPRTEKKKMVLVA